jgi:hypothetical protein
MKYKTYLYGAYGSNLNVEQMSRRCPDAQPVGTMLLHGWELKFRGVADIEEKKDALVPLGLWRITQRCEAALDIYEGYPNLYGKKICNVPNLVDDFDTNKVMIYFMNSSSVYPPSMPYLDCIMEGYNDFALDETYLKYAIKDAYAREEQRDFRLVK